MAALQYLTTCLVLLIAALHLWFMALEMFLWQKPIGLKTFRMSPDHAAITAPLAANQGLYNGFLAAGLLCSLFLKSPQMSYVFRIFFLECVLVAGTYGAYTVNRRIFMIQAMPALIALSLTFARF